MVWWCFVNVHSQRVSPSTEAWPSTHRNCMVFRTRCIIWLRPTKSRMVLEGWLAPRAFSPLAPPQKAHIPAGISSSGASAGSTSWPKSSPPGHRENQHQGALQPPLLEPPSTLTHQKTVVLPAPAVPVPDAASALSAHWLPMPGMPSASQIPWLAPWHL